MVTKRYQYRILKIFTKKSFDCIDNGKTTSKNFLH